VTDPRFEPPDQALAHEVGGDQAQKPNQEYRQAEAQGADARARQGNPMLVQNERVEKIAHHQEEKAEEINRQAQGDEDDQPGEEIAFEFIQHGALGRILAPFRLFFLYGKADRNGTSQGAE
jgi:hypothetical protein